MTDTPTSIYEGLFLFPQSAVSNMQGAVDHVNSILDRAGAEVLAFSKWEERRLAYVGITRARRNLFISFANSRRIHGQWQSSVPSRFVHELPADNIIEDMAHGMALGRVTTAHLASGGVAPSSGVAAAKEDLPTLESRGHFGVDEL